MVNISYILSEKQVPKFKKENGFVTDQGRSRIMARIKGKDTKPEVLLRKALWKNGIRFRKNVKSLPGCPDIVIKRAMLVIFIDGEFWHGFNWVEKQKKISKNRNYWIPKIERNIERDKINESALQERGYSIQRFWSREIMQNLDGCIQIIMKKI